MGQLRAAPLWQSGLLCRCPALRPGPVYAAYLKIAPRCTVCGLDYGFADAGDGPAVFVILIAGAFIVAGAPRSSRSISPALLAPRGAVAAADIGLCLGLLPPFKATLFALQYRNQAGEGRMDEI